MKCDECRAPAEVVETRVRKDNSVRRRYECFNRHRFSTVESVQVLRRGRPPKPKERNERQKSR